MRKFIWGAMLGAGIALLYAPATGAATRSKLRDKASKLGSDVTDFVDKKQRHLQNKMEGYKAKARNITERMQEQLRQTADQHEMSASTGPNI